MTGPVTSLSRAARAGAIGAAFGVMAIVTPALASTADDPGRRVALVIGNQDYEFVEPLVNPLNDTKEITRVLREADFDVTVGTNLSKKELEKVVRRFLRELNDGDTALFYYSGHALQVGEANFLLPVDAKLASQYDLEARRRLHVVQQVRDL
ncbi:MAG: caspase family protein, partial [Pseudomonadota bacterium]